MSTRRPARRRAPRGRGDDLRGEIVAAAKELLAGSGSSAAVSIRAVADTVGVTPPSIYLHFADKDALLDAVVGDTFADLDAAMLAAAEGVDEPVGRLCAFGVAYVRFAVDHPEHYRLATMERHGEHAAATPVDEVLADSAFSHLVEAVAACVEIGFFAAGDPVPTALEMWSAAHGVAALLITKPFLPWGDPMEFAQRALTAAALGRAVRDHHGDMDARAAAAFVESAAAQAAGPRR